MSGYVAVEYRAYATLDGVQHGIREVYPRALEDHLGADATERMFCDELRDYIASVGANEVGEARIERTELTEDQLFGPEPCE